MTKNIIGVCGIVGGLLIIIGVLLDDGFPKALWLLAGICELINSGYLLKVAADSRKKEKTEEKK